MSDSQRQRKQRGAFFTPPELSRHLVAWAVRTPSDKVLEPSCGEASFLIPAGERLQELAGGRPVHGDQLRGIELHEPSAARARELLAGAGLQGSVIAGDFFEFEAPGSYDAVVGNPPYVRYQSFTGEARVRASERALRHGVRLTRLASSWAPFVIHASDFLKTDGRMALVLPAELLTVNYAAEVRRFLLNRFGRIRLILFEELVFPGVLEDVVLLLAEGMGPAPHFEVLQVRDAAALASLDVEGWEQYQPDAEGKWTPALLDDTAVDLYRELTNREEISPLLAWGETSLGAVTGNNRYFSRTGEQVAASGLPERDLVRISPPGSRHLRGLTFTERAWQELVRAGAAGYLFYPRKNPLSKAAANYVAEGEAAGVHLAYKCRVRTPWYRVPLVQVPDLLLTYMDYERPRLVTNQARLRHLNSLYGVFLRREVRQLGQDLLPMAAINSFTMLGAEMVGRAYGGGMLKLEPREADKLPVPSPELVNACATELRALRPQLAKALRQNNLAAAVKLVDRVILTKGMGLTHRDIQVIRGAREFLFARRATRGGGSGGKN